MNEDYNNLLCALTECVKNRVSSIEYQHLLIAKSAIDKAMKENERARSAIKEIRTIPTNNL